MNPVAKIVKDFVEEVVRVYNEEAGDYEDYENNFHFAVWGNGESSMLRRNCICDEGIIREGVYNGGWY